MPTVAALATLGLLFLLLLAAWPYLARQQDKPSDADKLEARRTAGKEALAKGAFHQAAVELEAALRLAEERPDLLSSAEVRRLRQLHQQADLLDRLLSQTLREVLEQALAAHLEDEWQTRFRNDYRGKTVIFDDVVRLDEKGRPMLAFTQVQAGEVKARLAVEELQRLQSLPLPAPRRLVFGARLASLARETGGQWVIRFDPDSAVLLTNTDAFLAACHASWPTLAEDDSNVLEVVKGQKDWLEQLARSGDRAAAP
jgi:hypothetical protein